MAMTNKERVAISALASIGDGPHEATSIPVSSLDEVLHKNFTQIDKDIAMLANITYDETNFPRLGSLPYKKRVFPRSPSQTVVVDPQTELREAQVRRVALYPCPRGMWTVDQVAILMRRYPSAIGTKLRQARAADRIGDSTLMLIRMQEYEQLKDAFDQFKANHSQHEGRYFGGKGRKNPNKGKPKFNPADFTWVAPKDQGKEEVSEKKPVMQVEDSVQESVDLTPKVPEAVETKAKVKSTPNPRKKSPPPEKKVRNKVSKTIAKVDPRDGKKPKDKIKLPCEQLAEAKEYVAKLFLKPFDQMGKMLMINAGQYKLDYSGKVVVQKNHGRGFCLYLSLCQALLHTPQEFFEICSNHKYVHPTMWKGVPSLELPHFAELFSCNIVTWKIGSKKEKPDVECYACSEPSLNWIYLLLSRSEGAEHGHAEWIRTRSAKFDECHAQGLDLDEDMELPIRETYHNYDNDVINYSKGIKLLATATKESKELRAKIISERNKNAIVPPPAKVAEPRKIEVVNPKAEVVEEGQNLPRAEQPVEEVAQAPLIQPSADKAWRDVVEAPEEGRDVVEVNVKEEEAAVDEALEYDNGSMSLKTYRQYYVDTVVERGSPNWFVVGCSVAGVVVALTGTAVSFWNLGLGAHVGLCVCMLVYCSYVTWANSRPVLLKSEITKLKYLTTTWEKIEDVEFDGEDRRPTAWRIGDPVDPENVRYRVTAEVPTLDNERPLDTEDEDPVEYVGPVLGPDMKPVEGYTDLSVVTTYVSEMVVSHKMIHELMGLTTLDLGVDLNLRKSAIKTLLGRMNHVALDPTYDAEAARRKEPPVLTATRLYATQLAHTQEEVKSAHALFY